MQKVAATRQLVTEIHSDCGRYYVANHSVFLKIKYGASHALLRKFRKIQILAAERFKLSRSSKSLDKSFRNNFKDYFSYVIPAQRRPGQDSGRARAGVARLFRKSISVKKDRVLTRSYRIQAQY
jgi:hypothetical protein